MNSNKSRDIEVSLLKQPIQVSLTDRGGFPFNLVGILISFVAFALSAYTFYHSELREGYIKLLSPSRVGWVRPDYIHGRKNSDALVISFIIHNDGNKLKTIRSIKLTLFEEIENLDNQNKKHELIAVGKFEKLKEITYFDEKSLEGRVNKDGQGNPIPDYHYFLLTSLPIQPNEYYNANLLFLIQNEDKYKGRGDTYFALNESVTYKGKIIIEPFKDRKKDIKEICFKFTPNPKSLKVYKKNLVTLSQGINLDCNKINIKTES